MSISFSPSNPQFAKAGGNVWGADVEQLQKFWQYLDQQLTQTVKGAFDGASAQIPNIQWSGPDATKFESTWSQMLTQLANMLSTAIDGLVQDIKKQEQDQRTASQ